MLLPTKSRIFRLFFTASRLRGTSPILTYFINDLEDYLITYLLGVGPTIVSLILAILIKTESFEKNVDIDVDKLITNKNEKNADNKLVERFSFASEKNEGN